MHSGSTGMPEWCVGSTFTPTDRFSGQRMAASREKLRAHRKKKLEKTSVKLLEPMAIDSPDAEPIREKIKVPAKSRSALIAGQGRSMGMEID